ncbi:MAG: outer membrane lipoprotein carrier protein LolA [Aquificae bacterium]|nr:outer membrane lipoprotein carrier protein LolA [Aquificota bacterium]
MRFLLPVLLFVSLSYGALLEKLEAQIKKYQSIQGEFTQTTYTKGLDEPDQFEGILYLSKPDAVKIHYKQPIEQIYLLKGETLTIYTPEEEQAVITPFDKQFITLGILQALAGQKSLKSIFNVVSEGKNSILLSPKDKTRLNKVEITVNPDLTVKKISIWDLEGNKVDIQFHKFVYKNDRLNLDLKLPPNTEIIRY